MLVTSANYYGGKQDAPLTVTVKKFQEISGLGNTTTYKLTAMERSKPSALDAGRSSCFAPWSGCSRQPKPPPKSRAHARGVPAK